MRGCRGEFRGSPGSRCLDVRRSKHPRLSEVTECAVCDYIAGMTDRFAQQEFERLA